MRREAVDNVNIYINIYIYREISHRSFDCCMKLIGNKFHAEDKLSVRKLPHNIL